MCFDPACCTPVFCFPLKPCIAVWDLSSPGVPICHFSTMQIPQPARSHFLSNPKHCKFSGPSVGSPLFCCARMPRWVLQCCLANHLYPGSMGSAGGGVAAVGPLYFSPRVDQCSCFTWEGHSKVLPLKESGRPYGFRPLLPMVREKVLQMRSLPVLPCRACWCDPQCPHVGSHLSGAPSTASCSTGW